MQEAEGSRDDISEFDVTNEDALPFMLALGTEMIKKTHL